MKEWGWDFKDLNMKESDLEVILGFEQGSVPEPFGQYISEALSEVTRLGEARAGYRVCAKPVFDRSADALIVENLSFHTGKTVFKQIHTSQRMAFFIATAGQSVGDRIQELYRQGETAYGYVMDVAGTVLAEKAAVRLLDMLEAEAALSGLKISDSFSPGFCDWNVAEQQLLFSLFPAGFCGVTLSASSLMSPVKSVSGLAGIGPELRRSGTQCSLCRDENCFYGKINRLRRTQRV